jgi:hypothetical protein
MSIDFPSLFLGIALAFPLYLAVEALVVPRLAHLLRVSHDGGQ